jgi:hypothetical protein
MEREFGPWSTTDASELASMVRCSQFAQADTYRYIIETCRRRAFDLSGVLLWMGHDMIHVTCNNSVIEHDGLAKLSYYLSAAAFSKLHICIKFDTFISPADKSITGTLWLLDEDHVLAPDNRYTVTLRDIRGQILEKISSRIPVGSKSNFPIQPFSFKSPDNDHHVLLIRCELQNEGRRIVNDYVITQNETYPLSPLRHLPATSLGTEIKRTSHGTKIQLINMGPVAAIGTWPVAPKCFMPDSRWPLVIMPNEIATVDTLKPMVSGLFLDGLNIKHPERTRRKSKDELIHLSKNKIKPVLPIV